MEHTLAQSFELLSNILRCIANTVEYKNLKGQLNKAELVALKQLQTKQYLAKQKVTRSQQTSHHEHALTPTAPHSVGSCNWSITDVDEVRSTASSTQYFNISQDRLPITTVGDEALPTIDLRSTEHEVDEEAMHDVLTHYAHALADAAAEVSNHPNDNEREFHLHLQIAKNENAMDIATNHGLIDDGACADVNRKRRKKKKKRRS